MTLLLRRFSAVVTNLRLALLVLKTQWFWDIHVNIMTADALALFATTTSVTNVGLLAL